MSLLRRLNRRFLLRYRLEYAAALMAVTLLRAMSPSFAWRAARAFGRCVWRLGVRRKVVLTNLAIAFPAMDERERDEIGRKSMEHLASVVVDGLYQLRMLRRSNFYRRVDVRGWARRYLDEHGEEGLRKRARRILFLTGHMGNWEVSSGCFGLLGVSIAPVFRTPQNPWLAKLLLRIRLDSQAEFIERRGAVRRMLAHLESGGNVGFLFDQEALWGSVVPFFGHPAPTHKTPAVLAYDHGVQVFFGVLVRRGDFCQYEARGELIDPPAPTSDRNADFRRLMTDISKRLEAEIRKDPEQYFWAHRRWKRVGVHGDHLVARSRK